MLYVVFYQGRDEVVAVIVALVPAQGQRLAGRSARLLQDAGVELLFEKLVGRALVHENGAAVGEGVFADELAGVVLAPCCFVRAEVVRERLFAPGGAGGGRDWGEGRDAAGLCRERRASDRVRRRAAGPRPSS